MKFIKADFNIIEGNEQLTPIENAYNTVAIGAATCYKTTKRKEGESAKEYCERVLIHHDDWEKNHGAMFEHGTIYLTLISDSTNCFSTFEHKNLNFTAHYNWSDVVGGIGARYRMNKFSKVYSSYDGNKHTVCVTTNLRVILENNWEDDLKFATYPTENHIKRVTVKFNVDRFTGEEFIRHRVFSFARESTRYCNYSKDKFNNELTFILPVWLKDGFNDVECINFDYGDKIYNEDTLAYLNACNEAEKYYMKLISLGWQPQQARVVLPCTISSPLLMTGFVSDWEHFFNLRAYGVSGDPHPQAKELAMPLLEEFISRKYIDIKYEENS